MQRAASPLGASFILFTSLVTQPITALAHDANADFVVNSPNPNGVWQYGYSTSLGTALIPFNEYVTHGVGYAWRTNLASGAPAFTHFDLASNGVLPGETALHGGPSGEFAVLRFTAPSTGPYDILANWRGPGDTGNTDLYLLQNSNAGSPLGSSASTTISGIIQLSSVPLSAGDTIDLAVGNGGDGFGSDSTPVNLQITLVPEPAGAILLGVGLIPLVFRRNQRFPYRL
jgi:hypothetical protein